MSCSWLFIHEEDDECLDPGRALAFEDKEPQGSAHADTPAMIRQFNCWRSSRAEISIGWSAQSIRCLSDRCLHRFDRWHSVGTVQMANTVEHTGRTAVTRRSALFTRRTHVHSVRSLSIYKQAVVEISVSSLHTRCFEQHRADHMALTVSVRWSRKRWALFIRAFGRVQLVALFAICLAVQFGRSVRPFGW